MNKKHYDIEYIVNILKNYFDTEDVKIKEGDSGMNNTTRFVEYGDEDFVLRIYESHKDIDKVSFEHSLLFAIQRLSLPFSSPVPVLAKNGNSVVISSEGKLCALFKYISGERPSSDKSINYISYGTVVGKLTQALSLIDINNSSVYQPYYDIENTHPSCPIESVLNFCEEPENQFSQFSEKLSIIGSMISEFLSFIPKFKSLPLQLIHGDINQTNMLIDKTSNVSAILDFEFVTHDLRVMELCVCISDMINSNPSNPLLWKFIEDFYIGYKSNITLSKEELEIIPLLILLRRLDVFIHFLGRYRDGVDKKEIVSDQIDNLSKLIDWLKNNQSILMSIFI